VSFKKVLFILLVLEAKSIVSSFGSEKHFPLENATFRKERESGQQRLPRLLRSQALVCDFKMKSSFK
jgi:hypothetical protein